MTFTFKPLKQWLFLILSVGLLLSGTTFVCATEAPVKNSQITIQEAKNALDDYIRENHPDIHIGSIEYRDFLVEQLVSEHDKRLTKEPNYYEYIIYAARFISQLNNDHTGIVIKTNLSAGVEVSLSKALLDKTVSETITDFEKENKSIEEKASFKEYTSSKSILDFDENAVQAATKGYSPNAAANYGYDYGKSYNRPTYPDYTLSGDCTNFVSQCVKRGGKSFNYAPGYKDKPAKYGTTKYWYSYHYTSTNPVHRYKQSTSFMRVSDFYTYWKNHGATIISCKNKNELQSKAKKGDIVQLKNNSWYHSIIISRGSKGAWKYAAHDNDHKAAKISSISNKNSFRIIRIK